MRRGISESIYELELRKKLCLPHGAVRPVERRIFSDGRVTGQNMELKP